MITRQKVKTILMRLVASLLILFTFLVAVIAWMMTTQGGLHYSIHLAEKFIPGKISALSIDGRLTGPIDIKKLTYENQTTSIQIENGKINWHLLRLLFSGHLNINQFDFQKISVALKQKKDKTEENRTDNTKKSNEKENNNLNFSLPFKIELHNGLINAFELHKNNKTILKINQIKLSSAASQDGIRFKIAWAKLTSSLKNHQIPNTQANLSGSIISNGTLTTLSLSDFTIKTLSGIISGKGKLSVNPTINLINWQLDLNGDDINPASKWPLYPGVINFNIATTGKSVNHSITTNLLIHKISGHLNKNKLQGEGGITFSKDQLSFNKIALAYGDATLNLDGGYRENNATSTNQDSNHQTPQWNLQWKINIPKMSTLIPTSLNAPKTTGNFSSTGSINGPLFHPIVKSDIHASSINTLINNKAYGIKKLDGNIYLDLAKLSLNPLKPKSNSNASASFKSNSNSQSHLLLTASNINLHGLIIDSAKIKMNGDSEKNTTQIDILNQSEDDPGISESNHHAQYLHLILTGGLKNSIFYGDITHFKFNYHPIGTWALKQHSPFKIDLLKTKNISLQNLCLHASHQEICSSFQWQPKNWTFNISGKSIALNNLFNAIDNNTPQTTPSKTSSKPESSQTIGLNSMGLKSTSQINFTAHLHSQSQTQSQLQPQIQSPWAALTGDLKLNITPGTIHFSNNGKSQITTLKTGYINAVLNAKRLNLNAKIALGDNQKILGNLSIAHLDLAPSQQKIKGSLNATYTNFALINDLLPQVENAQGKLTSNIKIDGSVADPHFIGQAQLRDASLEIPDFGLTIKKINITAQGDRKGYFKIDGMATSGPGQLHLSGNIAFNQKGIPATLFIQGDNISVINNEDFLINISPHLNIDKKFKNIAVTGQVKISKAEIKPQDFGNSSVSLPDDVEFINGNVKKQKPYPISVKITLDMGNQATINTHGLKGKLEGKLDIDYNSETTTTAKGTLSIVDGYYDAYGQKLQIQTGKLIFAGGPINNPGIDIQAVRTILAEQTAQSTLGGGISMPTSYSGYSKAVVGVSVKGTLRDHKVSLISIPAIYSQSDILSLMLTGKTASGVSGNKAQLLLQAASSLKLGGSSMTNITQQLQRSLGLDELGIKSETYAEGETPLQTSSLVVGKRLFKKLFVSYSIGLLDPVSMLRVRYQFAKHWSLETSASTKTTGADLFYSLER